MKAQGELEQPAPAVCPTLSQGLTATGWDCTDSALGHHCSLDQKPLEPIDHLPGISAGFGSVSDAFGGRSLRHEHNPTAQKHWVWLRKSQAPSEQVQLLADAVSGLPDVITTLASPVLLWGYSKAAKQALGPGKAQGPSCCPNKAAFGLEQPILPPQQSQG